MLLEIQFMGKITNMVPQALQTQIKAQMTLASITGVAVLPLCSAIAFGICTHIMAAGTVTLTDIGFFISPPGPLTVPGTGMAKLT